MENMTSPEALVARGPMAATEDDQLYAVKRTAMKIATLRSTTAERSFARMTACCRVIGTPIVTRSMRRHGVTIILIVTMMMMSSPFIMIHIDRQRDDYFLLHHKVIGGHHLILSVCAGRTVKMTFLTSVLLFRYISCNTR